MKFHPSVGSLIVVNIMASVTLLSVELEPERAWSQTVTQSKIQSEQFHEHKNQNRSESVSPPVIPNLEYIDPTLSSSFFLQSDSYLIPLDVLPNDGSDAFRTADKWLDFYSPEQEVSILNLESNPLAEFPKFPETNWQDRFFRF